ncbi:hypothetical protein PR002_g23349 [Phytophthora rubi]|uniref:Uncharacterized protein n=1 Tax=Phytophthora rubi TaxID=129364 RepID=A0A6A3IMZ5_9STRA|nr:hypothetical protein PR002_g23349 [Phytophthora rubi]
MAEDVNAKWTMRELVLADKTFSNYPCARYATDVTFQQANIPYGLCEGRSIYYSGKHKIHGYKMEVSVFPQARQSTALSTTRVTSRISRCSERTKHFIRRT